MEERSQNVKGATSRQGIGGFEIKLHQKLSTISGTLWGVFFFLFFTCYHTFPFHVATMFCRWGPESKSFCVVFGTGFCLFAGALLVQ